MRATITKETWTIVPVTAVAGVTVHHSSSIETRASEGRIAQILTKPYRRRNHRSRLHFALRPIARTDAQRPADSAATPARRPPGAGHGECFLLPQPTGAPQVVRLHSSLDPYAMVMLPSGQLKVTELAKMKPTTDPFVAASQEQIIESLKATGYLEIQIPAGNLLPVRLRLQRCILAHARSILETMLPGVVGHLKSWGMTVHRPEVPLVVVIVSSRAAYDAIHPMPKEVIAYYNVNLEPNCDVRGSGTLGRGSGVRGKTGRYVIAHEGVHQLLANIGIQNRLSNWSPWICEGIAEYYCPLKANSNIVRKGNSELPARTLKWNKAGIVNDLRMWSLLKCLQAMAKCWKVSSQANEIDANGYALAWGLVHYLASKKPEEFRAYLPTSASTSRSTPPHNPSPAGPTPASSNISAATSPHSKRRSRSISPASPCKRNTFDPIENQTHYIVKQHREERPSLREFN